MGLLILSRKTGERLRLRLPDGTTIWIHPVDIQGDRVRIGIDAPKECEILREELAKDKR